ncbi:MAG: LLM class flavin-dependent oxidoreductase [Terrimesophilobacter sp.]
MNDTVGSSQLQRFVGNGKSLREYPNITIIDLLGIAAGVSDVMSSDGNAQLGVYINNRAAVFLGEEFTMPSLVELAIQAEDAGFGFVAVGDSVLAKPRFAPIVTLAAVAAVTRRIGLTTGILQPHLHHLVTLAQELATLDVISAGRTSLGVGLGTGPRDLVDAELALVGLSRKTRARAFEETISALIMLLSGGPTNFNGEVYKLTDVDAGYRPVQRPGPPIVIACGAYVPLEAGQGPNDVRNSTTIGKFTGPLERVVRLGDGWVTGMATPSEWRSMWQKMVASANAVGRSINTPTFERRVNCFVNVGDNQERARQEGKAFLEAYHRLPMDDETLDRWLISGPAEVCVERFRQFIDVGVNSFQLVLASSRQQEQLARVAEGILPDIHRDDGATELSAGAARTAPNVMPNGGDK